MRVILLAVLITVASVTFGQTTKKQPYIFDNWVELNDSLKIGDSSNLKDYGKFMKVDTLSDGTYYFTVDTVADVTPHTTSLPYDSITARPFNRVNPQITMTDSMEYLILGGVYKNTDMSRLFVEGGIEEAIIDLDPDATDIPCESGNIFYVGTNTVATAITSISGCPEGRRITIIGRTSGNTSTITSSASIVLTGVAPTLDDAFVIEFITVDNGSGIILLETNRNQ